MEPFREGVAHIVNNHRVCSVPVQVIVGNTCALLIVREGRIDLQVTDELSVNEEDIAICIGTIKTQCSGGRQRG